MRNYPFDAVRSEEGAKKSNNELSESGRIKEGESEESNGLGRSLIKDPFPPFPPQRLTTDSLSLM